MKKNLEGWKQTKSLGMVYVGKNGKVIRTTTDNGWTPLTPYKWTKKYGWAECSGEYTPSYLAKKMNEGKAKWA